MDLGMKVLDVMLLKLCSDSISDDRINPPAILFANLHGSSGEVETAEGDARARRH
jgi:hypothetical protein